MKTFGIAFCFFISFILPVWMEENKLKEARIVASKQILSSYAVERKELIVIYHLYNIGGQAALNVELRDENFSPNHFQFLKGSNVIRWSRIPVGVNVTHGFFVVPQDYGRMNFTAAEITYHSGEENTKRRKSYTTIKGEDIIYRLKDYDRRFEQHYGDWILFVLMILPSLLVPAMLWLKSRQKYGTIPAQVYKKRKE